MDTKKAVLLIAMGIGSMAYWELGVRSPGDVEEAQMEEAASPPVATPSERQVAQPRARVAQSEDGSLHAQ